MNTSHLKPFAQQARLLFREGVDARLQYWGFSPNGSCTAEVETVPGGYIFRGQVFNDASLPGKWRNLRNRIRDKQSYDDLVEEAAYTWFNRLMAIKILEQNNHEAPVLAYADVQARVPQLLQDARRGHAQPQKSSDQEILREYLLENKDLEATVLLLVDHCNRHDLLRKLFGRIDDYTELLLPDNLLRRDGILDHLNLSEAISDEDYREVELIGWLYQFYIADKKDQVFKGFKNKKKARPQDIPAATQIFTPRWIVEYMVQNTLGQTWLEAHPESPLRQQMKYLVERSEVRSQRSELTEPRAENRESRLDSRNPPVRLDLGAGEGGWGVNKDPQKPPAAMDLGAGEVNNPDGLASRLTQRSGLASRWGLNNSTNVTDLRLLDPAAGSGHILVVAFDLLIGIYGEAGYPRRQAARQILTHNIYGLDLDLRASQMARFALLLKAAQYDRSVLRGDLMPHVYAMPQPRDFRAGDVQTWLGSEGQAYLPELMTALQEMQQAHNIGSALKLDLSPQAHHYLAQRLGMFTSSEKPPAAKAPGAGEGAGGEFPAATAPGAGESPQNPPVRSDLGAGESPQNPPVRSDLGAGEGGWGVNLLQSAATQHLQAYLPILLLLTAKYPAVVANPPYMGGGNMNGELKNYLKKAYPDSKSDLFAVFMDAMMEFSAQDGKMACITMESWMFLKSYENLRLKFLDRYRIASLSHFGWHIIGIAFGTVASVWEKRKAKPEEVGVYSYLTIDDVDRQKNIPLVFPKKDNGRFATIPQTQFAKIPGSPIAYWVSERVVKVFENNLILSESFVSEGYNKTGANEKYLRYWFEVDQKTNYEPLDGSGKWLLYTKGGDFRKWFGNISHVIDWSQTARSHYRSDKIARILPERYWFRPGVTWSRITAKENAFRLLPSNITFDSASTAIFNNSDDINRINWALGLLNCVISEPIARILNPSVVLQVGDVLSYPTVKGDLGKELIPKISAGVSSCISISHLDWDARETSWDFEKSEVRSETSAGSLEGSYQLYQSYWTAQFYRLHALEEELNRIFIGIYGLEEELSPEVALSDITILQEELDRGEVLSAAEQALRAHPQAEEIREKLLGVGESGRLESEDWRLKNGEGGKREDGKEVSDEEAFDLDRATEAEKSLRPEILRLAEELDLPALPIRQDLVLQQFLSYCIGVIMGRYRLDRPGLHIAHPAATPEELAPYEVESREQENPPARSDLGAGSRERDFAELRSGGWGVTEASPAQPDSSAGAETSEEDIDQENSSLASRFSQLVPERSRRGSGLASDSKAVSPLTSDSAAIFHIDDDGIIPMIGSASPFSDDIVRRVTEVIRLIWGEDSLTANLNFLQAGLGMDLEKWLTTKFWDYHKKMYKKRPIYWLFQSPGKSFQVLVYMHRLDRYTLQQIRNQYLHPYQQWLASKLDQLEAHEADLTKMQQKELDRSRKALADCRDYDEQLKTLAAQQIEIDLDDGVVVNYAKFDGVVVKLK